MVSSRTVEKQIRIIEGFEVRITQADGSAVTGRSLQPFERFFTRGSRQTWTVQEWKDKKFYPNYEGFAVSVLRGDGTEAVGQTLLRTIRESYYE